MAFIKVLVIEPGKKPYAREMENSLEAEQKVVGGAVEILYPYDDPVALICNQNAKLLDQSLCRVLRSASGQIYDISAGAFIVLGDGDKGFVSLTDGLLEKYANVFMYPELIFGTDDEGHAVVIELPV